jgi:transposase
MTMGEKQRLLDEIAKRDEIIARQAAEILVLRQNIDALSRRIFGASSEKFDPGQVLFAFASDITASEPPADTPAALPVELPKNRKKTTKTRAPRIPDHLPVEREEIIPPQVQLEPESFRRMGEEITEQIHFKRAEFFRKQLVRGKYVRIDNSTAPPIIAPLPPSLQERCIASPGLITEVIYNRFVLHLPYYRQVEIFNSMGVNFHRKTLCDWSLLGSNWLDIIYREIQYEHWRSLYRQLDETPIRYLQPGSGKAQTGYLWTSNIPGGSVFFHWHEGRDAEGIDALFAEDPEDAENLSDEELQKLVAIIQCDGYQVYRSRAEKKRWLKLVGCQAHMRRKFFEALDQSPQVVSWILHQIALLYQIEERLRESKAGPSLREAVRASESRMIHRRLHKAIVQLSKRKILPRTKLGKAITYALNQWQYLEGYLSDGRVEIDNNLVENAIRPTKLGQKNWLFVGNCESGRKCAILYTIIENCRRLKIDVREYLTDVLTRLPAMKSSEAASLTPAAWQAARSGKAATKVA